MIQFKLEQQFNSTFYLFSITDKNKTELLISLDSDKREVDIVYSRTGKIDDALYRRVEEQIILAHMCNGGKMTSFSEHIEMYDNQYIFSNEGILLSKFFVEGFHLSDLEKLIKNDYYYTLTSPIGDKLVMLGNIPLIRYNVKGDYIYLYNIADTDYNRFRKPIEFLRKEEGDNLKLSYRNSYRTLDDMNKSGYRDTDIPCYYDSNFKALRDKMRLLDLSDMYLSIYAGGHFKLTKNGIIVTRGFDDVEALALIVDGKIKLESAIKAIEDSMKKSTLQFYVFRLEEYADNKYRLNVTGNLSGETVRYEDEQD